MKPSKYILKTGIHGVGASLSAILLNGNNSGTKIDSAFFKDKNLMAVVFGIGLLNSIIVDNIHGMIKPEVNRNSKSGKFVDMESSLLSLGISVATMNAFLYFLNPNYYRQLGMVKASLIGAGSEIISEGIINVLEL